MLPQKRRVSKSLFPQVSKRGNRISSDHFSLTFVKNEDISQSKFAVVVSSKVSKKAAIRNLIRRRVYAIIRNLNNDIKLMRVAVIVYVKNKATLLKYKTAKKEIMGLLKKGGLM